MTYSAFLHAGYRITPQVNAFVEVDDNVIGYSNTWYNSNSYRIIGGLSSDLIGLFRGEIYAGGQEQYSLYGNFQAMGAGVSSAVLLSDRYLSFAASLNDSFGSAAVQYGGAPASPSSTTVEARFQAMYQMFQYWSANAFAGYGQTDYSNSSQRNNTWTLGAGVNLNFWRNTSVSLNYQYYVTNSNVVSNSGIFSKLGNGGFDLPLLSVSAFARLLCSRGKHEKDCYCGYCVCGSAEGQALAVAETGNPPPGGGAQQELPPLAKRTRDQLVKDPSKIASVVERAQKASPATARRSNSASSRRSNISKVLIRRAMPRSRLTSTRTRSIPSSPKFRRRSSRKLRQAVAVAGAMAAVAAAVEEAEAPLRPAGPPSARIDRYVLHGRTHATSLRAPRRRAS